MQGGFNIKKSVSFYIEEELLEELRKIAAWEYRSLNKQIMIAIREYVNAYQKKS